MASAQPSAKSLQELDALLETGALQQAVQFLVPLEKSFPDSVPVQVARARITAAQGDATTAIRSLSALAKSAAGEPLPKAYLGALLVSQDADADAIPHLEWALKFGGDVPAARQALGMALLRTGQGAAALPHLQSAVKSMPGSWAAWYHLGICLGDLGQWAAAEDALHRAALTQPSNIPGWELLARARVEKGDIPGAAAALDEGIKHNPAAVDLMRLKVQVYVDQSKHDLALVAANAIPVKLRDVDDWCSLATLEMAHNHWDVARTHAKAAVKADTTSPRAHYTLGLALESETPLPKAAVEAAYRAALEHGDPAGDAGTRLGFILMEQERPEAVDILEGALERSEGAAGTRLNLALAYAKNGRKEDAAAQCLRILETADASASTREQATRLRAQLSR